MTRLLYVKALYYIMRIVLFALATLLACSTSSADIIWDENVNGDLSSDNLNPTVVATPFTNNQVIASTTFNPLDRDFLTITVDPGFEMTQIVLEAYQSANFQSFYAVEIGGQITSVNSPASLLGTALIGGAAGTQVGDNVLDDLGMANLGGSGFTGSLGAGTYTFWFQETGADVDYQLNYVIQAVVPEPGSMAVAIGAIGCLVLRRRRS